MENTENDEIIQWHPRFVVALKEYFKNYPDIDIIAEYNLSNKPLRIDVLIKQNEESIDNKIGSFFRNYNIIEYKSPDDSFSVDDFYKVLAYAYLYKSLREDKIEIDMGEMTISIFGSKRPIKLFKYLQEFEKFVVKEKENGIYYIQGLSIPIQIINLSQLDKVEEEYSLMLFSNKTQGLKLATEEIIKRNDILWKKFLLEVSINRNKSLFQEVLAEMQKDINDIRAENEILDIIQKNFNPELIEKKFSDLTNKNTLKNTAIRLLTKKFGVLSENIKSKIEKADFYGLEIVIDNVLDSDTLEEAIRHLK